MSGKKRPMSTLYVGGLPCDADAEFLRGLFEPYASVKAVRLVRNGSGGSHRGFGYVTLADAAEAQQAAAALDGVPMDATRLRVARAT